MANHLKDVLSNWYPMRDQYSWVIATVIAIKGSSYRKTGAMMLINEVGQYYGLISGGCLEKSLLADVKKVLIYKRSLCVCFDSGDDAETGWAKALGCGGKVTILLQPVDATNDYQALDLVYESLCIRKSVFYSINIHADAHSQFNNRLLNTAELHELNVDSTNTFLRNYHGQELLIVGIRPPIHMAIFGGGIDAIPLVKMATVLGWQLTLIDNRVGYADEFFFENITIIRTANDSDEVKTLLGDIDAAIVMTHNIAMDALALNSLQSFNLAYIGLLGPAHRKQKVLKQAGLATDIKIYGPMGFDIGGDLPESVALSVLAQCHQVLELGAEKNAQHNVRQFSN
ncbi:MAG: XdhC family protein [Cellvibrio sp.]